MLVCITCQWRPDKKEGLGVLLRRALDAGKAAGLGAPAIDFRASEVAIGKASAIARVVKRYPELAPLRSATAAGALPGGESLMSQRDVPSPLTEELLLAVADGIPRSWALQSVSVALHWPVFGALAGLPTGLMLNDMAWISGRRRVLAGVAVVEAEPAAREIVLPPAVAAVFGAFGKPAGRTQQTVAAPGTERSGPPPGFDEVFARHRAAMVARIATLPHALATDVRGEPAGPKKPALEAAFKPMGYSCRGGTGEFTLSRRTAGNLVVQLDIDVGTWSNRYLGTMTLHAPAWKVGMKLLLAPGSDEVPIAGPEGWQRIVDNLATQVAVLDREFVPEVEALLGPAPAWHERSP